MARSSSPPVEDRGSRSPVGDELLVSVLNDASRWGDDSLPGIHWRADPAITLADFTLQVQPDDASSPSKQYFLHRSVACVSERRSGLLRSLVMGTESASSSNACVTISAACCGPILEQVHDELIQSKRLQAGS